MSLITSVYILGGNYILVTPISIYPVIPKNPHYTLSTRHRESENPSDADGDCYPDTYATLSQASHAPVMSNIPDLLEHYTFHSN